MANTKATLGTYTFPFNPDSVIWAYNTNTNETFTKGGKVIQILSCFVDQFTVTGELGSGGYEEMRKFEQAFVTMALAQQQTGKSVRFSVPSRSWDFSVFLKTLPSIKFTRETTSVPYSITLVLETPVAVAEATDSAVQALMKTMLDGVDWVETQFNNYEKMSSADQNSMLNYISGVSAPYVAGSDAASSKPGDPYHTSTPPPIGQRSVYVTEDDGFVFDLAFGLTLPGIGRINL